MAIIKSNICKQCGGLLDIDIDRQVYICPFCGVTFDYEYFRTDNVLEIAKKAVNRNEFGAAKDAYDYMLKKDPHNFEALRGLILCKCKWTTLVPMLQNSEVHLLPDEPVLLRAIENCLPEHRDYFNMIKQALEVLKDYRKSRAELANLENDRIATQKKLRDINVAQAVNNAKFTATLGEINDALVDSGKLGAGVVEIGLLILIGLGYVTIANQQYWIPVILVGIILFSIAVYNINKLVTNKTLEAAKGPVRKKLDELETLIDAKNTECVNYLQTYKTLTSTIVTTYRMEEPADNKETARKNFSKEEKHQSRTSSDFPSSSKVI